jgi:uncharacterized protein (TIGR02001 family)
MRTSFNSMRGFGSILGLSLALMATPALAQEEESKAVTVSGGVTLVSDYRFRGISQTDKDFAVQGSITVTHETGLYASIWGSTVDDYVAAGGDQEIDLIAGFKKTFGSTTVDVGGLYYYYPGSSKIVPGYNSDFLEFYGSVAQAVGPVTAKLAVNFAPKQKALAYLPAVAKEDNFYGNFSLSGTIPDTKLSLTAAIGRTFTRSFLSGGIKYTDWSVGASYTTGPVTFGISYVDTSAPRIPSPSGKDIYKGGIVASLGVAF